MRWGGQKSQKNHTGSKPSRPAEHVTRWELSIHESHVIPEHFVLHRSCLLIGSMFKLLRHTFAPLAEKFIHRPNKLLQDSLIVSRRRREKFVENSKEFETGVVNVQNQIEQFRFDRAQLTFVEFDDFRQEDLDRVLIPDGVEHPNELSQLTT